MLSVTLSPKIKNKSSTTGIFFTWHFFGYVGEAIIFYILTRLIIILIVFARPLLIKMLYVKNASFIIVIMGQLKKNAVDHAVLF